MTGLTRSGRMEVARTGDRRAEAFDPMKARILSLNVGQPAEIRWRGKNVVSSMHKTPVDGSLLVSKRRVKGDRFADEELHGTPDRVLYALGVKQIEGYVRALGLERYEPGSLGENITLDTLDERKISVGDIFKFGDVLAQATSPRFPCRKVNFQLRDPKALKTLHRCGNTGVYFRILKPGRIRRDSPVSRVKLAEHRFSIPKVYDKVMWLEAVTKKELETAVANGAFPADLIERWKRRLQGDLFWI
jgi:MOSC domain-containing protein YiiM